MLKDFLLFRRMLTPLLIALIFWIGSLSCIVAGGAQMIMHHAYALGLQLIFVGPLLIRLACELVIVLFRINETLTDIKNKM